MTYAEDIVEIMEDAIHATDGSPEAAYHAFHEALIDLGDPELVWRAFVEVRIAVLSRLFRIAKFRLDHPPPGRVGERTETRGNGAPESGEPHANDQTRPRGLLSSEIGPDHSDRAPGGKTAPADDMAQDAGDVSLPAGYPRQVTFLRPGQRKRSADSAAGLMQQTHQRRSPWSSVHNHAGVPLGNLSPLELLKWGETGLLQRTFAQLATSRCPPTDSREHPMKIFLSDEEAVDLWERALFTCRIDDMQDPSTDVA